MSARKYSGTLTVETITIQLAIAAIKEKIDMDLQKDLKNV